MERRRSLVGARRPTTGPGGLVEGTRCMRKEAAERPRQCERSNFTLVAKVAVLPDSSMISVAPNSNSLLLLKWLSKSAGLRMMRCQVASNRQYDGRIGRVESASMRLPKCGDSRGLEGTHRDECPEVASPMLGAYQPCARTTWVLGRLQAMQRGGARLTRGAGRSFVGCCRLVKCRQLIPLSSLESP